MSEEESRETSRVRISQLITLGALLLALTHVLFPAARVDAVAVTLFAIAVAPWLGSVFRVIELPGGVKVEYQELERAKQEAEKAGLLAKPKVAALQPAFLAVATNDPNLALAGLRIEIEKRLRAIADAQGLEASRQGIGSLLRQLSAEEVLSPRERSVLADLIGLLNGAVHGADVDQRAAQWALEIAPQLLGGLDELVAKGKVTK